MNTATARTRRFGAVLGLLGLAIIALAGPAGAAPYGGATGAISVTTTSPIAGQPFGVSVSNATPGDRVEFVLHSQPVVLGTFTVRADGNVGGNVKIPADFSGQHTIVATDLTTNQTWTAALFIDGTAAGTGGGSGGGTGSLPFTGVAVVSLGVLALVLFAGGGTLLLLGRRRLARLR